MKVILSLVFSALALLSNPSHAGSVRVTHMKGELDMPTAPQRIAVLDFAMLDNIANLAVTAEIALPKRGLPSYLEKYKSEKYPDLGSLKEFNLETISAFKPQAIFISTRQAIYYDELSKIAPVYIRNGAAKNQLEESLRSIEVAGKIFAKENEAQAHIKALRELAAQVKQKAQKSPLKALFILTNDGKISSFGKTSRFGIVFNDLGVKQAGREVQSSNHGHQINYQFIALANPDIIYVLDRSAAIGQTANTVNLSSNALIKRTKAVQNGKVIAVSPQIWYLVGGGIHATKIMLNEIAQAF